MYTLCRNKQTTKKSVTQLQLSRKTFAKKYGYTTYEFWKFQDKWSPKILHLSDKLNVRRSHKQVSLSALSIYYLLSIMEKHWKKLTKTINLKFQNQRRMMSVLDINSYWVNDKKTLTKTDENNMSITIYLNKIWILKFGSLIKILNSLKEKIVNELLWFLHKLP